MEYADILIVLPTQLFQDNELINNKTKVYLVEHPVYFTNYKFHKMKLVFHRATMKYYEDYIRKKYKCTVKYLEFKDSSVKIFSENKGKIVHVFDPVDHLVLQDLEKDAKGNLEIVDTPAFIATYDEVEDYFKDKKKATHHGFYTYMRKQYDILMTGNKPKGGKWSYDTDNRKPFPDKFKGGYNPRVTTGSYINEAKRYIERHFKNNPGSTDLYLPIDHDGAKRHYKLFLKDRFKCFGPYQDAVRDDIPFGCHSVISPLLNSGLLTPLDVVQAAEEHKRVPIQSVEGYIRQVIGWREYTRGMYQTNRTQLEKPNFFKHRRKLKDFWFTGTTDTNNTGMPMIDDMIDKAQEYSYLHHIERLMYIGNFMLLTETNPQDVFDWFISTVSLDAYNWVMYSNVYGMSQFSCGPIMMTRPYFSSSNYIEKMSNYSKRKGEYEPIKLGDNEYEWFEVWDALYYNFINNNKGYLAKNYATAQQVKHWNNKTHTEKKEIIKIARLYLKYY